ncbi:sensor domain-containing diguanylate cyclase [Hydrocarboniclastica marina]|nr:diguanylate cyclase [Hydrocarboniclastica marina]|tara:strand:- start:478 stop:2352 length:1875 start_codon:yes stop_codon:yes gene_type:complete
MPRIIAWISILLGFFLSFSTSVAALPVSPDTIEVSALEDGQRSLGAALVYAADPGAEAAISDIIDEGNALEWQRSAVATPNFGVSPPVHWFAVSLANESANPVQRLLQMDHPLIDYLDVYVVRDGRVVEAYNTGDARPLASRPWEHRTFVFPLELSAEDRVEVYLRAQTDGALAVPLRLWDKQAFFEHDQDRLALQMLFVGIMAALAIYNSFLLLATRDWSYLWYVLSIITISTVVLSFHGITAQFVWADHPRFNNLTLVAGISGNVFAAALFAYTFLNISRQGSLLRWFFIGTAAAGALVFIANFFLPYKITTLLAAAISVTGASGAILVGAYLWYRGDILARFYTTAWFLLLAGSVLITFSKFGILPHNLLLEHAQQIGAVAEGLLLSFALAYRMNLERKRRFLAQAELLHVQREANRVLEKRVRERTNELEVANRKLLEANAVDGLTKVKNRQFFDEMLAHEWSKNARGPSEMSLLMIDGDHFKRINDSYGHLCGDACLQHLARIYQGAVNRAGDFVARYGGEEFTVLLCYTDRQGAAIVAERIRKQVADTPLEWEGQQIQFTVSIGVSSCIPAPHSDMKRLIREADEALYAAKHGGRNQVVVSEADLNMDEKGGGRVLPA